MKKTNYSSLSYFSFSQYYIFISLENFNLLKIKIYQCLDKQKYSPEKIFHDRMKSSMTTGNNILQTRTSV